MEEEEEEVVLPLLSLSLSLSLSLQQLLQLLQRLLGGERVCVSRVVDRKLKAMVLGVTSA